MKWFLHGKHNPVAFSVPQSTMENVFYIFPKLFDAIFNL
jgi:hypothetical protein